MEEKDIILKIKALKAIKPRESWVLLTKENIFQDHQVVQVMPVSFGTVVRNFLQPKMAISFAAIIGLFVSTASLAQHSLPGDLLYSLKRATENGQVALVSDDGAKLNSQLDLVNKRLDELTEVKKENKVNNLAAAISEVQASISETSKNLKKSKPSLAVASQVKKIKLKTTEIKSLGVEIGETEFDATIIAKIKEQVDTLNAEKLTVEQLGMLEEVKKDIAAEDYADAWEKILVISGINN